MPHLHLSLPPHGLLLVAGGRRRLLLPSPAAASVELEVAAAAEAYGLPFPSERAAHHRELAAAAAAVERACRLCVDVKRSLLSGEKKIFEKSDQTLVTVADFGVQALISLELQRSFPSIPLVAEEDSASLRSSNADSSSNVLVESISSAVADNVSNTDSLLTHDDVLRAIDKGGKDGASFDSNPATYWVLDPIDGTQGFSKVDDTLYVVGLALVVNGKVVAGVMGSPNWASDTIANRKDDSIASRYDRGILMIAHEGCGTWTKLLYDEFGQFTTSKDTWNRCFVDSCSVVHKARYCLSDNQTWNMIPLSVVFNSTTDESKLRDENELLTSYVFSGSLCKYLTVAYGRASVFVLKARTKSLKSWDHTIGVICVLEAGGQVTDWRGEPLDLEADLTGRRDIYPHGGILITNGGPGGSASYPAWPRHCTRRLYSSSQRRRQWPPVMRVSPGEGRGGGGGCGGLVGALEKRPVMGLVAEEEEEVEKGATTTLETSLGPSRSRHTRECRSSTSRRRRAASSSPAAAAAGYSSPRLPATPASARRRRLSGSCVCVLDRAAASAAAAAAEAYGLPFPPERAAHHRELAAAAAAVERACRLCVDVKRTLLSGDKKILEKNDQTPVTVADFGVQALISLELQRLFPLIPLVAEEDSASLRSSNTDDNSSNVLVESISSAVAEKVRNADSLLTHDDVLRAIDRGGKNAVSFDSNPASYWVLDPIDGTKGFLGGDDALYVVGLALVVNEKVVAGVMGCPNWSNATIASRKEDSADAQPDRGILMIAHVGCGTWARHLSVDIGQFTTAQIVNMARFCIPDSQTWNMIPLSVLFNSTMDESNPRDENEILLLSVYCGSLCKYLTVASGRASVFVLRARTKNLKSWDHAVGVICVQEAGGQISDWSGKPLDLAADLTGRRDIYPSGGVLVTNGALHGELVEMISANHKNRPYELAGVNDFGKILPA
uniref:3'(2'),5'-bisphosphate nucleotidase n=1 Tax=Oryza meridionalis TaxID=40149 RepID=A0A0E0ED22_9ORYZ